MIMEVFREFTPTIEPLSVDEAFLDISGSLKLFGGAICIGKGIRKRVFEETGGLTVSIGIAPNKFLAKLASDLDKPDGMTVVDPDRIQELLDPLPVKKIWGVGPRMTHSLQEIGLNTISDLRRVGIELLQEDPGLLGRDAAPVFRVCFAYKNFFCKFGDVGFEFLKELAGR